MISTMPVTREEMRQRAAALVPRLQERAAQTEQLRRLPDETLDDLVNTGLLRIGNPDRFGGLGLDIDAAFDVTMELGRGCGSTAWTYSVLTGHNWMIGHWPEQGQEEVFAYGPDTFASSGFDPSRARVEVVPGGYRLSGQWSFSSGCDAARWAMVGGVVPGEGNHLFLVPMGRITVVDDWFVTGLRGSGSKSLTIDDVLVPDYRVVSMGQMGEARTDGWTLHGRPSYRVPMFMLGAGTLAAPVVSIAQGAVEAFAQQLQGRRRPDGSPLTHSVASHLRLAESSAEADAARCLIRQNCHDVILRASRGETLSAIDRFRYRRDYVFMAKLAVRAIGRLVEEGGAHAVQEANPLQRFYRDALTASQHHLLRWDEHAEQYGRVLLGLEPNVSARP